MQVTYLDLLHVHPLMTLNLKLLAAFIAYSTLQHPSWDACQVDQLPRLHGKVRFFCAIPQLASRRCGEIYVPVETVACSTWPVAGDI